MRQTRVSRLTAVAVLLFLAGCGRPAAGTAQSPSPSSSSTTSITAPPTATPVPETPTPTSTPPGLTRPAGCPSPAPAPSGALPQYRLEAGMTYDDARNLILLWGGLGGQDVCDLLNDTWTWNGSSWTRKSPSGSPPAGNYPSMAYDAAHGVVVLFAGGQTWTWDGATWTQPQPSTSPPARGDGAMAFDAALGKVVLFSGIFAPNDTWTWDGTTWVQLHPPVSPPARSGAGMAYDELHGVVVLFGGSDPSNTYKDFSDTWTFDGTKWTNRTVVTSPAARYDLRLAYDGQTRTIVLWGGQNDQTHTAFTDTWTWDGNQWSQQNPPSSPQRFLPRDSPTMLRRARSFYSVAVRETKRGCQSAKRGPGTAAPGPAALDESGQDDPG